MKKVFLPIVVCAAMAMTANAVEPGNANIYASGLKVVNEGSDVQFVLNAPGDVTINFYKDGKKVDSIEKTGLEKGLNTVSLAGVFGDDVKENDQLTWEVVATAEANTEVVSFHDATQTAQQFGGAAGIAIENDSRKMNFGKIFISNALPIKAGENGRETNDGIYVLNSDLSAVNEQAYTGNVSWANNTAMTSMASPKDIALDKEGNLFIGDWSDSNVSGVWMMDTESPENDFVSIFDNENLTNTKGTAKTSEGDLVHGSVEFVTVVGEGENRTVVTFDEEIYAAQGGSSSGKLVFAGYKIGDLSTKWASKYGAFYTNPSSGKGRLDLNPNNKVLLNMISDNNGGIWVSQTNTGGSESWPSLMHVNSEGTWDYLFSEDVHYYDLAISPNGAKLVVAEKGTEGKLIVYDVTYTEGKPTSLTKNIEFISGHTDFLYGMALDVDGNVYVATNRVKNLLAYALPKAENTYTTAANDVVVVSKTMTGVEEIATENAPVEYYNLQGVKVNTPENGIFIRKQGAKTTKVVF